MTTTAMSNNNNSSSNNDLTKNNKSASERLANFSLQVFERTRQLQRERTGLLLNQDGMKIAVMQCFEKAVADINLSIAHIRLFAGEGKEETIKSMLDKLGAVSVVAAEKQEPQPRRQPQQIEQPLDEPKHEKQQHKEREECCAP